MALITLIFALQSQDISGYLSHGFPAPEAPEVRPVSYSRPGQFEASTGPAGPAMVSPKTWPWATHGNTTPCLTGLTGLTGLTTTILRWPCFCTGLIHN